jgi:periplasmic protein TonB
MTSLRSSSKDAASFWMVFASVLLHAAFLGMVIMASSWVWDYKKPREETVTQVTLIPEPAAGPVLAQKIQPEPAEPPETRLPDSLMAEDPAPQPPEPVTTYVEPRLIDRVATAPIPLAKRKRKPLTVEAPKEPEKEKPEPKKKPKEPKEDPKAILAKRMAEIQKEVENKYKERSAANNAQTPGSHGNRPDGEQADRELNKWIELVKGRVNAHWSIMGDTPRPNAEALIGIEISDNGVLVRAKVDKSSGDQLFDRSAMRAITLAAPFPPVPLEAKEKIKRSSGLALRFTPGGMQ